MPSTNETKKLDLIRDLLIGSKINRNAIDLFDFLSEDGREIQMLEVRSLNEDLGVKKIKNEVTITFEENQDKASCNTSNPYDYNTNKESLNKLSNKILPPSSKKSSIKNAITIFLPRSGSKISEQESSTNSFTTKWNHYNISDYKKLDLDDQMDYCLRLHIAFCLLQKSRSSTLDSIIKSFDLPNTFHTIDREYNDLMSSGKYFENTGHHRESKTGAGLHEVIKPYNQKSTNKDKYNIFYSESGYIRPRIAESQRLGFKKVVLKSTYHKNPKDSEDGKKTPPSKLVIDKYEQDRQRILLGLAYTLALFSGDIITIELPLVEEHTQGNKAKEKNSHLIYKNPVLIAPEPITDMFQDLKKYHQRLDTILQLSTSERHSPLDLSKMKFNSAYTVHLLINHTRLNSGDFDSLMKIIGHFKKGCEPEELIRMLKVSNKIVVKNNYYNNVMPRKAVKLPNLL